MSKNGRSAILNIETYQSNLILSGMKMDGLI